MSQMTLRQGIETTLLEEVPELTRVLDVTDHGSGENPFYRVSALATRAAPGSRARDGGGRPVAWPCAALPDRR